MSVRRDEKKMKIEKAKQILERCANESARLQKSGGKAKKLFAIIGQ